jgi:hypothetical protein
MPSKRSSPVRSSGTPSIRARPFIRGRGSSVTTSSSRSQGGASPNGSDLVDEAALGADEEVRFRHLLEGPADPGSGPAIVDDVELRDEPLLAHPDPAEDPDALHHLPKTRSGEPPEEAVPTGERQGSAYDEPRVRHSSSDPSMLEISFPSRAGSRRVGTVGGESAGPAVRRGRAISPHPIGSGGPGSCSCSAHWARSTRWALPSVSS